jgi:hypothetical protein
MDWAQAEELAEEIRKDGEYKIVDVKKGENGYVVHCENNGQVDYKSFEQWIKFVEASEPKMEQCKYCLQWHYVGTVEQCPLNPNRKR